MRGMGSWSAMKTKMMMGLILLLVLGRVGNVIDAAAPSAAQCKLERKLMVNACNSLLYGKPPSPNCCRRIRVIPLQCVCAAITPKLAALIDVKRAIRLVEGCGRRIPRHFKCGSITTP